MVQAFFMTRTMLSLPRDRAFHFGDGLFSTAQVLNGQIQLLELHKQRLQRGVELLGIDSADIGLVINDAIEQSVGCQLGVIKLVVTRGEGGRGYSDVGVSDANYYSRLTEFPEHYLAWRKQGVDLGVAQVRLGLQPMLAGLKHLNRLEQVMIRRELDRRALDEAVVLDINDNVIEGCSCNIFWSTDGQWYTPELSMAGVAGVMREHIVLALGKKGIVVKVVQQKLAELLCADTVFICNALMNVVPVNSIDGQSFSNRELGEILEIL